MSTTAEATATETTTETTTAIENATAIRTCTAGGRVATLVPGLVLVGVGLLAATAVNRLIGGLSTLVAAVMIGVVIGNTRVASADAAPGLAFAAKRLMRVGVVLLGLRLSVGQVADLGLQTLGIIAATVTCTFFGVQWVGRKMGLSPGLSLLVATGFSICGLSAIAAVEDSSDATEEEVTAAMGLVTMFGTMAIFVIPFFGGLLGMSDRQLGIWSGAGIHDTAQVVAAASTGGAAVLAVAVAVKLTRVLLLAPIVAGLGIKRSREGRTEDGARPPIVPFFVAAFVAMILVRTSGVIGNSVLDAAKTAEGLLLAAAMVGLGAAVRLQRLRALGPKPIVLGVVAWLVVAVVSLGGVLLVG